MLMSAARVQSPLLTRRLRTTRLESNEILRERSVAARYAALGSGGAVARHGPLLHRLCMCAPVPAPGIRAPGTTLGVCLGVCLGVYAATTDCTAADGGEPGGGDARIATTASSSSTGTAVTAGAAEPGAAEPGESGELVGCGDAPLLLGS